MHIVLLIYCGYSFPRPTFLFLKNHVSTVPGWYTHFFFYFGYSSVHAPYSSLLPQYQFLFTVNNEDRKLCNQPFLGVFLEMLLEKREDRGG